MSDTAITKDSLLHYDNRHIQVRWDFYCLCSYDKGQFHQKLTKSGKKAKDEPNQECMAMILRVLETLTDHKKTEWSLKAQKLKDQGLTPPPEPKEFPLELSYSAICSLLYGTYGESTVRNSIAYLIQIGFIKQYQQTKNSIPFYILQIHVLQQALKDQAENDLSGVEIDSQTQVSKSTASKGKTSGVEIDSQTSEIDTNNIYKNSKKDNKQKEESIANDESATPTSAPVVAPSPSSLFVSEETKPSSKKKERKVEDSKTHPVMPPANAPWPSKETAVQIVEAKKGRHYSATTRKQELAEAGQVLEMTIDGMPISREQFESAWDDLASSSWWEEHGKPCMIKYLRRDDTIIGIIKKLAKKGQAKTKSQPTTTVKVEDSIAQRNIDRMMAAVAAQGVTL